MSEAIFYGEEGRERLLDDPTEVIEDIFDNIEMIENFDYPFIVKVFKKMEICLTADSILDDILERLDDEYADPDGDFTQPTEAMIKSAEALVETIKREYYVSACEPTGEKIEYSKKDVLEIIERDLYEERR